MFLPTVESRVGVASDVIFFTLANHFYGSWLENLASCTKLRFFSLGFVQMTRGCFAFGRGKQTIMKIVTNAKH